MRVPESAALWRLHQFMRGRFYPFRWQFRSPSPTIIIRCCRHRLRSRRFAFLLRVFLAVPKMVDCNCVNDELEFMPKRAAIITFNNSRHSLVVVVRSSLIHIDWQIYYSTFRGTAKKENRFIEHILVDSLPPVTTAAHPLDNPVAHQCPSIEC